MGVIDGQPVSADVTNPAFIDANADDTALGRYTYSNTDPQSGPIIDGIQGMINNTASGVGASVSSPGVGPTIANLGTDYPSTQRIAQGQNHRTAISNLDTGFHFASGHKHTGLPGDGPSIAASGLSNVPLVGEYVQSLFDYSVTGSSFNVSSSLGAQSASSGLNIPGVVVNPPYNKSLLRYGSTGANSGFLVTDSSSNLVYGRLSVSGSVWTMDFLKSISGVETPHTFVLPTDIRFYYQKLFNPFTDYPVYSSITPMFDAIPSGFGGGGGGGSGDVIGPAGATSNAIPRYDGSTGKLIKNSAAVMDDNGNIQNAKPNLLSTTVSANYAALVTDVDIFCNASGGGFSVLLPANPPVNSVFAPMKTDSSFYQVDVTPTGGPQVYDQSGSVTVSGTNINTYRERVVLKFDGVNYRVLDRDYYKGWVPFNINPSGQVSDPVKGLTDWDISVWKREDAGMRLKWNYKQNTAGTASNGQILFNLPTGAVSPEIDTDIQPLSAAFASAISTFGVLQYISSASDGFGAVTQPVVIVPRGTNSWSVFRQADIAGAQRSNFEEIDTAGFDFDVQYLQFNFDFLVPIKNWKA